MLLKIGVFIGLCILVSCQPYYVTYNTIGKLEKGMTPERVYQITDMKPDKEFTIKVNEKSYTISVIDLQTGISVTTTNSGSGLPGSPNMTYTETTHHTNNFYLLYKSGKLRYWGMRNEYSKSEDPEIASLSNELYRISDDFK